jgi:hypothetical protein
MIEVRKIYREGSNGGKIAKWVAYIDGKFTAEALTKADATKWAQQQADWLRRQNPN